MFPLILNGISSDDVTTFYSLFSFLHSQLVLIHSIRNIICTLEFLEWSFQPFTIFFILFCLHTLFSFLFTSNISAHLLLLLKLMTRNTSHLSFAFNQRLLIKDNVNAVWWKWQMQQDWSNEGLTHLSISGEREKQIQRGKGETREIRRNRGKEEKIWLSKVFRPLRSPVVEYWESALSSEQWLAEIAFKDMPLLIRADDADLQVRSSPF